MSLSDSEIKKIMIDLAFNKKGDISDGAKILRHIKELDGKIKQLQKQNNWISVKNELPKIGQKVYLFTDETVQEEIYMYDMSDVDDWNTCQFWSREDIDHSKILNMDDMWQPLPGVPE